LKSAHLIVRHQPPWVSASGVIISDTNPHSGSRSGLFNSTVTGNFFILSQNLTTPTIIGATYTFSFWLANNVTSGVVTVGFTGTAIPPIQLMGPFGYTPYSYNVVATSVNTTILFQYVLNGESNGGLFIDDVSAL